MDSNHLGTEDEESIMSLQSNWVKTGIVLFFCAIVFYAQSLDASVLAIRSRLTYYTLAMLCNVLFALTVCLYYVSEKFHPQTVFGLAWSFVKVLFIVVVFTLLCTYTTQKLGEVVQATTLAAFGEHLKETLLYYAQGMRLFGRSIVSFFESGGSFASFNEDPQMLPWLVGGAGITCFFVFLSYRTYKGYAHA